MTRRGAASPNGDAQDHRTPASLQWLQAVPATWADGPLDPRPALEAAVQEGAKLAQVLCEQAVRDYLVTLRAGQLLLGLGEGGDDAIAASVAAYVGEALKHRGATVTELAASNLADALSVSAAAAETIRRVEAGDLSALQAVEEALDMPPTIVPEPRFQVAAPQRNSGGPPLPLQRDPSPEPLPLTAPDPPVSMNHFAEALDEDESEEDEEDHDDELLDDPVDNHAFVRQVSEHRPLRQSQIHNLHAAGEGYEQSSDGHVLHLHADHPMHAHPEHRHTPVVALPGQELIKIVCHNKGNGPCRLGVKLDARLRIVEKGITEGMIMDWNRESGLDHQGNDRRVVFGDRFVQVNGVRVTRQSHMLGTIRKGIKVVTATLLREAPTKHQDSMASPSLSEPEPKSEAAQQNMSAFVERVSVMGERQPAEQQPARQALPQVIDASEGRLGDGSPVRHAPPGTNFADETQRHAAVLYTFLKVQREKVRDRGAGTARSQSGSPFSQDPDADIAEEPVPHHLVNGAPSTVFGIRKAGRGPPSLELGCEEQCTGVVKGLQALRFKAKADRCRAALERLRLAQGVGSCPNGHQLVYVHPERGQLAPHGACASSASSATWYCDHGASCLTGAGRAISSSEPSYRCECCDYDVCGACHEQDIVKQKAHLEMTAREAEKRSSQVRTELSLLRQRQESRWRMEQFRKNPGVPPDADAHLGMANRTNGAAANGASTYGQKRMPFAGVGMVPVFNSSAHSGQAPELGAPLLPRTAGFFDKNQQMLQQFRLLQGRLAAQAGGTS